MRGNCGRSPKRGSALDLLLAGLACLCAVSAGCAPSVESPEQAGLVRDQRDELRIVAQLEAVPTVAKAFVTLSRGFVDPLRGGPPPRPTSSVVLVIDADADAAQVRADARALVVAIAPELAPEQVTVIARPRPAPVRWARVGPFAVAPQSRRPLLAAAVGLLAVCAALGLLLALRERGRRVAPPVAAPGSRRG